MFVFRTGLPVIVALVLGRCCLEAEEPGRHPAPTPLPSVILPGVYKDYELLGGSLSPDGRMALLNPRREVYLGNFSEGKSFEGHLYLVSVSPFKVLSAFPGGTYLVQGNHSSYEYVWAKDSSAVLVTEDAKWGPAEVHLATVSEGKDIKFVGLGARVRKLIDGDFKASKARPYNDVFDFIFERGYPNAKGWVFNDKGAVVIDCVCTTDPKGLDKNSWTVSFHGVWNIGKAAFAKKEWTREPARMEQ